MMSTLFPVTVKVQVTMVTVVRWRRMTVLGHLAATTPPAGTWASVFSAHVLMAGLVLSFSLCWTRLVHYFRQHLD